MKKGNQKGGRRGGKRGMPPFRHRRSTSSIPIPEQRERGGKGESRRKENRHLQGDPTYPYRHLVTPRGFRDLGSKREKYILKKGVREKKKREKEKGGKVWSFLGVFWSFNYPPKISGAAHEEGGLENGKGG